MSESKHRSKSKDRNKNTSQSTENDRPSGKSMCSKSSSYSNNKSYSAAILNKKYPNKTWVRSENHRRYDSPAEYYSDHCNNFKSFNNFNSHNFENDSQIDNYKRNKNNNYSIFNKTNYNQAKYDSPYSNYRPHKNSKIPKSRWDTKRYRNNSEQRERDFSSEFQSSSNSPKGIENQLSFSKCTTISRSEGSCNLDSKKSKQNITESDENKLINTSNCDNKTKNNISIKKNVSSTSVSTKTSHNIIPHKNNFKSPKNQIKKKYFKSRSCSTNSNNSENHAEKKTFDKKNVNVARNEFHNCAKAKVADDIEPRNKKIIELNKKLKHLPSQILSTETTASSKSFLSEITKEQTLCNTKNNSSEKSIIDTGQSDSIATNDIAEQSIEKTPKISLVPLNNLLKENILSEINSCNLLPDNILDSAKQDLTEKLVNKVAKMDKIGIKNVINNPATKFDEALKQKARQHLRDEIRKQLRNIHYEHQNTDGLNLLDETFEANPFYNHEEISQVVLEQIRRTFGIDLFVETTSNEGQLLSNAVDSIIDVPSNNLIQNNNESNVSDNSNNNNSDKKVVADSTSGLSTNELTVSTTTSLRISEENTFSSPFCIDSKNIKTSPEKNIENSLRISESSATVTVVEESDVNVIENISEFNCKPQNHTNCTDTEKMFKSSPKRKFCRRQSESSQKIVSEKFTETKKKLSPKNKHHIGFKENEVLTIDSSSNSSNDSSSSSDSSSDSDSSSSSSSSDGNKKYKNRNPHLENNVINRFRRLVLPNLSKYLQKKFDEKYSKTTSNSISFIYDICLSKIFKNSTLTQNAKKVLKLKLKSLKKDEILQFLFDNMKDLFRLTTQEKHTNDNNYTSPSKLIENLSSSAISRKKIDFNLENPKENNQTTTPIPTTTTLTHDNNYDANENCNKKDLCKPTIQFDKKSLNLIANELKKFAEQQKNFLTEKRTISQSSEKESLSSTSLAVNESVQKLNSSTIIENDNSITVEKELELETAVSANRISSIKNNQILKHQTPNKINDNNTSNTSTVSTNSISASFNDKKEGERNVDAVEVNHINNKHKMKADEKSVLTPSKKNLKNNTVTSQGNSANSAEIFQSENNKNNKSKNDTSNRNTGLQSQKQKEVEAENQKQNLQINVEPFIENEKITESSEINDDTQNNMEFQYNCLNNPINHDVNFKNNQQENTLNDEHESQEIEDDNLPTGELSSSNFTRLSKQENDSADLNFNDSENTHSENEMNENYLTSPSSSRAWKSPGEKKCIEILSKENTSLENISNKKYKDQANSIRINEKMINSLMNSSSSIQLASNPSYSTALRNNNFESVNLISLVQQNKIEEAVVTNLKEIDLKLLELHKRKMFVEEMILKLQKDKMEIDFASMQLQNEKFLIINAAVASNNRCNLQNQQQNPLMSFQAYLNSTNNMMNEPLSASDYISNMFQNNQNSTATTSTATACKRKRPNSQSSTKSNAPYTKKLRSQRKNSQVDNDDIVNESNENNTIKNTNSRNSAENSTGTLNKMPKRKQINNQTAESTSLNSSAIKTNESNTEGLNNANNENNSEDTDDNSEEEDSELVKEILKASKSAKNGSYSGFKFGITQIKICGKFLIASSQDGNIYKYCWKSKEFLGKFAKHTESVTQIYIDRNNSIYSISLDGFLKKTSIEEFGLEMQSVNLNEPLQSIDVKWDTVYVGSKWGNIFSYNVVKNKVSDSFEYSANSTVIGLKATKIRQSQNLKILIIGTKTDQIQIINATNGHSIKTIETTRNLIVSNILLNEEILFCGLNKNELQTYNIKTGCNEKTIRCGDGILLLKMFRKKILFVVCSNGLIHVIDTETGKEIYKYKLCESIITALDFAGEKMIYASKMNKMQMEDIPTYILTYK